MRPTRIKGINIMSNSYSYHYVFIDTETHEHLDSNFEYYWNDDDIPHSGGPKIGDIIAINSKKYYVLNSESRCESEMTDLDDHGSDWDYRYFITFFLKQLLQVTPFTILSLDNSSCTIVEYTGAEEVVKIPLKIDGKTVVKIASKAFHDRNDIKEVVFPNMMSEIDEEAFIRCRNLASVFLPDSLTEIGKHAFLGCSALNNVIIPKSVTKIGSGAFNGCASLMSIKVSEGNNTFDSRDNCNAIVESATNMLIFGHKNTVVPDSVRKIGEGAFSGCEGLTYVVIPNSVIEIGDYAFFSCITLNGIVIPESVTKIGAGVFSKCTALNSINIPNSVAEIGAYAFSDCTGLTSVVIPNSITKIDYSVFKGCTGLISVVIPGSVTKIDNDAFSDCISLANVVIPNSVKKIDWRRCFLNCESLKKIEIGRYVVQENNYVLPHGVKVEYIEPTPEESHDYMEWSTRSFVLRKKEAGAWSDTLTYMDVHNGKAHMFGHEMILYEGGSHMHVCRDLLGISIGELLNAWKVEFKYWCPTWASFSQEIKREFTKTNAYYGQGVGHFKYFLDKYKIKYDEISGEGRRLLLYFHGFGSSGEGSTVKTLQELLPDWLVFAPDIPVDPAVALTFLKELCTNICPELIVGTSMGGMYAQQMRGFKRICINPAFNLSRQKDILKEGTFEFFNARKDGETTFTITPEIISHFEEMEAHQFDGITDEDRENVYGLFADNDTTVNCEEIFRQHYQNVIHFHGEHRLNWQVIEEVLVPLIKEITSK